MPISTSGVSSVEARTMVDAAIEHAAARGLAITVAVCDPGGALVAFGRSDGAIVPAVDFAVDKAYTAATLGTSTEAFGERMAGKASLGIGLGNRHRLTSWAGGLPVFSGSDRIGGIGVSGASDNEDVECAGAAVALAGFNVRP